MAAAVLSLSRRTLLAVAALTLTRSGAHAADATRQPALDFLSAIYDSYRNHGPGIARDDRAALNRYFTQELAALIAADDARAAAAGEVPNLNADPFIDAQDGEIRDIAVTVSDAAGGRVVGRVTFTNSGEPKAIELDLVETGTGWRIDDIRWPEANLRSLYAP